MEGSESTAGGDAAGNVQMEQTVLSTCKPLHRFIKREPKTLGVVLLIFGCAELLMGCQLSTESRGTSFTIYAPLWQGILFLACGSLSVYTQEHPSKRLVTMCLSMYIVSVLGIIVSFLYRVYILIEHTFLPRRGHTSTRLSPIISLECILMVSSVCVLVMLIFLCAVARLALRSTRSQVIVHHVRASQTTITAY